MQVQQPLYSHKDDEITTEAQRVYMYSQHQPQPRKPSPYGTQSRSTRMDVDERHSPSVVETTLYSPYSSLTEDTASCSSPEIDEVMVSPPVSLASSEGVLLNTSCCTPHPELINAIAQLHDILNDTHDEETENNDRVVMNGDDNRNQLCETFDVQTHTDEPILDATERERGKTNDVVLSAGNDTTLPPASADGERGCGERRRKEIESETEEEEQETFSGVLLPIDLPPSLEVIEMYKMHGNQEKFLFTLDCYRRHRQTIEQMVSQNNTAENNSLLKYVTMECNYLEEFYHSFQYNSNTSTENTNNTTTTTATVSIDTTNSIHTTSTMIDTASTTSTTTDTKSDTNAPTATQAEGSSTASSTSSTAAIASSSSGTGADLASLPTEGDNVEMGILASKLDENDKDDPQCVVDYVSDIFTYFGQKEIVQRVNPGFMSIQTDVNEKMRAILIDWMIDVQYSLKLLPETLYLSINILDHYLSLTSIRRDQLQLVGISSMVIACKYEEIFPPECNDFIYISDNVTTHEHILRMERNILTTLRFSLTFVSPLDFLRRYSRLANSNYTTHSLCKYLLETMLLDVNMAYYLPSMLAAAAVYLARVMGGVLPYWTPGLESATGYDGPEVRKCAMYMNSFVKMVVGSTLKTVRKKYSASKYGRVALIEMATLKD